MSAITSDGSTPEEEQEKAVCECGKILESGWQCSNCRRHCPNCNRALSLDPHEYCERCFHYCQQHGLYQIQFNQCPLCSEQIIPE